MNILLLPNSFKGSLSARQTARVLTNALQKTHRVKAFPLSDGGDGFVDFFHVLYPKARLVRLRAKNAFLRDAPTSYLWLEKQKTAVVETARVCGLGKANKKDLDPLGASSYGVGEVIAHAVRRGAKKIYVGLGGVACHDGGAGLARALGVQFLDKNGKELPNGAEPLKQLKKILPTEAQKRLRGIKIYAVADVTNPMLGPKGSARVFGPQKGASPSQVLRLERALAAYARSVKQTTGKDVAHTPSTAAAGALCAGLYGLLNAQIILGADFLQAHLPLDKWAAKADLIITSEGKLDEQTFYGKAPLAALNAAQKYKKPLLFICGRYEERALKSLPKNTSVTVACLCDFTSNEQDSFKNAAKYLRYIAQSI